MDVLVGLWKNYLINIFDILIVAYILYKFFMLIKGTRAVQVLRGLLILVLVTFAANALRFHALSWLLKGFWVAGVIAIVIVFQPELRNILASLGQTPILKPLFKEKPPFINEIIKAIMRLSKEKTGTLIILEQKTGLKNYVESGTIINGEITEMLFVSIFSPSSPLHDGAIIIQDERLTAAGCILPLTHEGKISKMLGTRHRAAVGITEVSDSWAIIVSEETGEISLAKNGKLERNVGIKFLSSILTEIYEKKTEELHKT